MVVERANTLVRPYGAELPIQAMVWLANQNQPSTQRVYGCELRCFMGFVGVPLGHVRVEHLIAYKSSMRGLASATVARKLSTLRSFYGFCVESGYLDRDPTAGLKLPRVASISGRQALTIGEAERLLTAVDRGTRLGRRDYAMLAIMLVNALRVAEVVAVRWGDFSEMEGYQVLLVHGKGGKSRLAKIMPAMMKAVRSYKGHERWVAKLRLFPLTTRAVAYRVKHYAALAGIEKLVSPHVLRHTGITAMLGQGAKLPQVQAVAGHADPKTTMRYSHLSFLEDNAVDYNPIRV